MNTQLSKYLMIVGLLFPSLALADQATGVIRNINCGSHSFGFDVPPLIRMYTNSATRFEGTSCSELHEGDKVEVNYRSTGPGTAIATSVRIANKGSVVRDLRSDEILVHLNQNFLMGVSQTARLEDEGKTALTIRSLEFINTLCKDGYDCSGEGEVGMRFNVNSHGKEQEILLTSQNGRKPASPVKAQIFGYEIQLIECGEDVVSLVIRKS